MTCLGVQCLKNRVQYLILFLIIFLCYHQHDPQGFPCLASACLILGPPTQNSNPADQLLQLPPKMASNQCHKPDCETASTCATSPAATANHLKNTSKVSHHLILSSMPIVLRIILYTTSPSMLYLLALLSTIPPSSAEHHTPLA